MHNTHKGLECLQTIYLTLSTLGKIFSRRHFEIFSFVFSFIFARKQVMANPAELARIVVKVNCDN